MIRQTLAALALASIVGCSNTRLSNPFASSHPQEARLAAYAARTPYPAQARAEDANHLGALINPKNQQIEVINFTDRPLTNVNLWVNGTFLYRIDSVPAQGTRTVSPLDLYDTRGQTLASLKTTPDRVELQSADHLYVVRTAVGH